MKNELKLNFEAKGYFLYKNYLSIDQIGFFLNECTKVLELSYNCKWPFINVYNDFFNIKNKPNLFAVQYPLNAHFGSRLYELFNQIDYSNKISGLTNWKNFDTTLIKLHSFKNFYNYYGNWHRDDDVWPTPKSVQSVLYIKNEKGFRIIPRSKIPLLKSYGIKTTGERTDASYAEKELPSLLYDTIDAEAGDLLIFESGLLHQGFCKSERLHFHLRHENLNNIPKKDLNNTMNFVKSYLPDVSIKSLLNEYPAYKKKNDVLSVFKRIFRTIQYFFPRIKIIKKNLLNKSQLKENIFKNTIWQ